MGNNVNLYCYQFENSANEEIIDGIKIIREGSRNLFNFYVPWRYLTKFKKQDYDIVIDDINKIPFYLPLFVKKPVLAISHHFFGKSIFREAGYIIGLYVLIAEKLIDFIYKKTPFVVVSQSTLDEFINRGFNKDNFKIVGNAITQSKFPLAVTQKSENPTITYFGRLKKYKCVDHLVQAFNIVIKKIPDAKLEFIGRGDYQPYLEKMSKELGINNSVTFHGFVDEETKNLLLSKSHLVVNTSLKEGWGITNIEANACGTPVVSADVPGLRDSVKEGVSGILYQHGNIDQLAAILIDLLQNPAKLIELSEGAVQWAKTFSWDDSAKLMYERLKEVSGKDKENSIKDN